jgi:hypothetical protein
VSEYKRGAPYLEEEWLLVDNTILHAMLHVQEQKLPYQRISYAVSLM